MPIINSDISFLLSGGSSNNNPDLSLGGEPSSHPLSGSRLFDDVSADDAEAGLVDYRCFYIANDHGSETLYDTSVLIQSEVEDGASVQLGIPRQDDIQQVVVNGTATGGSFILDYDGTTFEVAYNATLATWASNFQTAITAIADLEDVAVSASSTGSSTTFQITFAGQAGFRYHPLITEDTNSLTGGVTLTISKIVDGTPINSFADEIDVDTTAPVGVLFESSSTEIAIGPLHPADVFAIWVKRTTPAGVEPIQADGFTIRLKGSPVV
jgi:hypothetical protein